MSVRPRLGVEVPELTARVARASNPAGTTAMWVRDRLDGLRAEDWRRPSPCPGWTILGLCGHLLGDDLGLLARHRDGHHGTVPPDGATEGEFIAWLDDMQAEWVHASRRLSPRLPRISHHQ